MRANKFLALLLAAAMLLSLAGCGGFSETYFREVNGLDTYFFGNKNVLESLSMASNPLDAQEIYDSIVYDERMFYGRYMIYEGYEEGKESFLDGAEYVAMDYVSEYGIGQKSMLYTMPYQITAGTNSLLGIYDEQYEWASLYFFSQKGYTESMLCTYTVSGNEITFTPLSKYNLTRDENYNPVSLEYELSDTTLVYTFSFRGPELTLSNGKDSVTLTSYEFTADRTPSFSGYADPGSPSIENFNWISGSIYADGRSGSAYCSTESSYGEEGFVYYYDVIASYSENGLFTLAFSYEDEYGAEIRKEYHFVAFIGGSGALVLCDGENTYFYTYDKNQYQVEIIGEGMTDEEKLQLEELEASEVEQIIQKKADLLIDLSNAFVQAGLSVQINSETGEIALDSAVLFDVNEYEISGEGKEFLKQFLQVYTSVVFDEKYADFVSRIQIEGHTDTNGSYEMNLELSQNRADSVMAFCLSEEAGVDAAHAEALAQMLSAVGYSYDKPVYGESGAVDMDASRRVSFRFIVKVG